ncbi:hypothetical protein VDG1235_2527 [Verrucomicrobiia bacterium DG1235]|nr:hypothetical protein VDG1235_2527 [Verrucomicrobiae bacterium DG1235]
MIAARKAAPPVAAVGAVAITFFAVSNTSHLLTSTSSDAALPLTPIAQSNEREEPESFFVVHSQRSDAVAEAELEALGTVYQINTLDTGYDSKNDYQLNATPVTFSHGSQAQSLGAKVISAKPSY